MSACGSLPSVGLGLMCTVAASSRGTWCSSWCCASTAMAWPSLTLGALYGDVGLGAQPVAQPAELQTVDALNAGNCAKGGLGRVDQFRFYRVHQPAVDVSGCAPEYEDDGDGDQQADDRVGQRESGHHPDRTGRHR